MLRKRNCSICQFLDSCYIFTAAGAEFYPCEPFPCPSEKETNHLMHPAGVGVPFEGDQIIHVPNIIPVIDGKERIVPDHVDNAFLIPRRWFIECVQLLRFEQQPIFPESAMCYERRTSRTTCRICQAVCPTARTVLSVVKAPDRHLLV